MCDRLGYDGVTDYTRDPRLMSSPAPKPSEARLTGEAIRPDGAGRATTAAERIEALIAAMTLATPTVSLIGAVGAALTLGTRRSGVLISLLVLPLYIPVLIFGVAAIDAGIAGLVVRPHLLILGAMLIAALPLAPWAAATALRQALT